MSKDEIDTELDSEDISLLLPWYVTDALDANDRRRVEAYIAEHPEVSKQLELIREELEETIVSNEKINSPSHDMLEKILSEINSERQTSTQLAKTKAGITRMLDQFIEMLSPAALRWSAVAMVALLIGQAVVIGSLVGPAGLGKDSYQTATGTEQSVLTGTYIIVRFKDAVTSQQISSFLQKNDAVIVDGPKPGDLYKIRISDTKLGKEELNKMLEGIRANRDTIEQAFPAE